MTTEWFDGPYSKVRRADAILVPCAFREDDNRDLFTPLDRLAPSQVDAPPGTLTPDDGRTVVLRIHGGAWCLWLDSLRGRNLFSDGIPLLDTWDQHTGAPWKVYMTSNAPPEFKALLPERYEMPWPLPREPIEETKPYFLRRYPHLDTRPLRERV